MLTSVLFCVKKLYIGRYSERQMTSDVLNGYHGTSLNAVSCDFRIFSATIFIFKFYIQIIDGRLHPSSGQKHFCFHVLLSIFRSSITSVIYPHKVAMNNNLLHQNTANIHERNRYGSSVLECISTRYP